MKKSSQNIASYLKRFLKTINGLESAFTCWKVQQIFKLEYTETQRQKLLEAAAHLETARKIFKDVYAEILGRLLIQECDE